MSNHGADIRVFRAQKTRHNVSVIHNNIGIILELLEKYIDCEKYDCGFYEETLNKCEPILYLNYKDPSIKDKGEVIAQSIKLAMAWGTELRKTLEACAFKGEIEGICS